MTTTTPVRTKDVTDALIFFIGLAMLGVDDEGYVYSSAGGEKKRIKIGQGDQEKPVVIYREDLPKEDVHVLNPFAEGLGDRTPPQIFFYKILRAALNARLSYAVDGVMQLAMEKNKLLHVTPTKKDKLEVAEARVHLRLLAILGRITGDQHTVLEDVDDKMLEEFRKFFDQHGDRVVEPVYKPSLQRTDLLIAVLTDAGFVSTLHNIRKKSIPVLQEVLRGILSIPPGEACDQFSSKRIEGAPGKLSSWLLVLYKLYHQLNEVIDALDDDDAQEHLINLDTYQFHLDNLPAYTNNAKWMMVAAPPAPAAVPSPSPLVPQQLPGMVPNFAPMPPALPNLLPPGSNPPPGYKFMPGPVQPNGVQGPPVLVRDTSSMPGQMEFGAPMPMQQGYYQQPSPFGYQQQPYPQQYQQPFYSQAGAPQPNPFLTTVQPPMMTPYHSGMATGFAAVPGMPNLPPLR